jgi:GNAT superfamily N-acetyltransferase
MGGLTGIQWENGLTEISLLLSPDHRGQGVGEDAVLALLEEAFERMRLNQVVGECYSCSPALPFWQGLVKKFNGGWVTLPQRKYWAGQWFATYSFWFWREEWPPTARMEEAPSTSPVEALHE